MKRTCFWGRERHDILREDCAWITGGRKLTEKNCHELCLLDDFLQDL